MEIQQFRKQIVNRFAELPRFIDTKSSVDNFVWNKMLYGSEILLQLISIKILPIKKISLIVQQFDNEMEDIVVETDRFMNVSLYYIKVTEYILQRSIEEEMYETATNFRNFIDIYFNQQNNNTTNGTI